MASSAPRKQTKPKRPRGRPTKLTDALERKIVAEVRAGNYIETAAAAAGIDKTTLYDWMRRAAAEPDSVYAHFTHAVERARAQSQIRGLKRIGKAGEIHWQAEAWRLERTNPTRFALRTQLLMREYEERILTALRDELEPDLYDRVVSVIARQARAEGGAPA